MKHQFLRTLLTLHAETKKRFRQMESYPSGAHGVHPAHASRPPRQPGCGFMFRCDGCGVEFAPTPDSFILTQPVRLAEPDAEDQPVFIDSQGPLSRGALEALNEFELAEWGLTEEGRQTLLRGETIFTAAEAFCGNCLPHLFD